ncbi:GroES-like zinc-binding alcohol dehydrogenase family protein [Gossypium australe]|uniref:GroES-like zinc-binding alcohol dehydrogenase family protein n=1 Tax=Gossypium australe TaxID=47621 RepID=A0A5B6VVU4_9ROSI|nr:GroES-like zinc-binding alcohol dehydrogenase family protein [Gossypium australe]
MDIENGYFLAKFQNIMDCEKVLSEGPWIIFGQYLIQHINFPVSLIDKVAKLDMNTDNRIRGCFARMAMYINLDKSLVSQVLINEKIQRVKYEILPTVCSHYGWYGHVKEVCSFRVLEHISGRMMPSSESSREAVNMVDDETGEKTDGCLCWWRKDPIGNQGIQHNQGLEFQKRIMNVSVLGHWQKRKVTLALILGRTTKLGIYGIKRGKKQQMKESKVMGLICLR